MKVYRTFNKISTISIKISKKKRGKLTALYRSWHVHHYTDVIHSHWSHISRSLDLLALFSDPKIWWHT